jgi:FXSXX-COOH protein
MRRGAHVAGEPDERPSLPPEGIVGDLVDLTGLGAAGLDFTALEAGDDGPLARSIARLLAEAEHPDEAVAGFNSSI